MRTLPAAFDITMHPSQGSHNMNPTLISLSLTIFCLPHRSVDVVVSNCVINLAPDKAPVFREIARVLKPGGELYFSDVYTDRRVPAHLQKDKVERLNPKLKT